LQTLGRDVFLWTRRAVLALAVALAFVPNAEAALRAAFYYPWYPATWTVNGAHVSYHPLLGYYSSSDPAVVDRHVQSLNYANVDVAIASWWGPHSQSESTRIPLLLSRTNPPLKWALFYECEGNSPSGSSCPNGGPNPSVGAIQSDLTYASSYTNNSSYMRINGRPLIFLWSTGDDPCEVAARWKQAAPGWFVVAKISSGFRDCAIQPDGWHQYAPSSATQHHAGYSYAISPGFKRADGGGSSLARDINRWYQQVKDMVASGAPWQLVTTFNEWGEGTAVEAAEEWNSPSGYGQYLDALHSQGTGGPGPGASVPPSGKGSAAPRLRRLSVSPRRFRAARRGPAIAVRAGTTVRYRLSAAATVRLTIERLRGGKRLRGRIEHRGGAGLNKLRFRGRIRGRALRAGRYRLIATPVDSAGRAGASKKARFRIIAPRRR
jgi:hypothetical protein